MSLFLKTMNMFDKHSRECFSNMFNIFIFVHILLGLLVLQHISVEVEHYWQKLKLTLMEGRLTLALLGKGGME